MITFISQLPLFISPSTHIYLSLHGEHALDFDRDVTIAAHCYCIAYK